MYIDKSPYWFSPESIKKIEELYSANYMGFWCTKRPNGGWNEQPVDVFYTANPDISKGHTHYFGMFREDNNRILITNAESAFSEPIAGVLCEDGEVLVSRYRHHYLHKDGIVIDGGRDYIKTSGRVQHVDVFMNDGKFTFRKVEM